MSGGAVQKIVPELGCRDFAASLAFYTDILGFTVLYDRPEEGFAYLEREGARLMIDAIHIGRTWLKADAEYPLGRGVNLQIEAFDVDALYRHVQAAKADIFMAMEDKWYRKGDTQVGNRQFIVTDPDGYLLRFFQDLGTKAV